MYFTVQRLSQQKNRLQLYLSIIVLLSFVTTRAQGGLRLNIFQASLNDYSFIGLVGNGKKIGKEALIMNAIESSINIHRNTKNNGHM